MKLTTLSLALASVSLAAFAQTPAPAPAGRLLCLYLDLNSLSASDLETARASAIQFLEKQATPGDRIAVMTYASQLTVLQDFTSDHDQLVAALRTIMPGQVAVPDDVSARLQGIQAAAGVLEALPEKKAILYFSRGIPRTAAIAEALSATLDSLEPANVALYPVDARGVVAPPR